MKFLASKGQANPLTMFNQEKQRYLSLYGKGGSMPDGQYIMTIEKQYPNRSNKENRYSRVVYSTISDHTGEDPEDVKLQMQKLFLSLPKWETCLNFADKKIKADKNLIGSRIKIANTLMDIPDFKFPWEYRGTSSLNTKEFEIFMEKIRRWAAMFLGLDIPEPNEREK